MLEEAARLSVLAKLFEQSEPRKEHSITFAPGSLVDYAADIRMVLSQLSAKEAEIERLMALCNETITALAVARACLEKDGRFVETVVALNEAIDGFHRRAAEALRLSREGK